MSKQLSAVDAAALCAMQPVLLRRTKSSTIDGQPVVKLPPREQQLVRKAFSMSEQKFYDQVQAESMQQLKVCASAANVHINDVHTLISAVSSGLCHFQEHATANKLKIAAPLLASLFLCSIDCLSYVVPVSRHSTPHSTPLCMPKVA